MLNRTIAVIGFLLLVFPSLSFANKQNGLPAGRETPDVNIEKNHTKNEAKIHIHFKTASNANFNLFRASRGRHLHINVFNDASGTPPFIAELEEFNKLPIKEQTRRSKNKLVPSQKQLRKYKQHSSHIVYKKFDPKNRLEGEELIVPAGEKLYVLSSALAYSDSETAMLSTGGLYCNSFISFTPNTGEIINLEFDMATSRGVGLCFLTLEEQSEEKDKASNFLVRSISYAAPYIAESSARQVIDQRQYSIEVLNAAADRLWTQRNAEDKHEQRLQSFLFKMLMEGGDSRYKEIGKYFVANTSSSKVKRYAKQYLKFTQVSPESYQAKELAVNNIEALRKQLFFDSLILDEFKPAWGASMELLRRGENYDSEYWDPTADAVWKLRLSTNHNHASAFGWFCQAAVNDQKFKYRKMIEIAYKETSSKHLQKYAMKCLKKIPENHQSYYVPKG